MVIPDGTLRRGASSTRWAYNGVASILTTFTAEVGCGSAVAELTAADIERAVFVSWKGIKATLGNGGVGCLSRQQCVGTELGGFW